MTVSPTTASRAFVLDLVWPLRLEAKLAVASAVNPAGGLREVEFGATRILHAEDYTRYTPHKHHPNTQTAKQLTVCVWVWAWVWVGV